MSDLAAAPHSASTIDDAGERKAPEVRVCEAFSNPAGNVIFKSSDDVLFRVEDYYLKANSGFFRDMLNDSVFSSTIDNPLPLDEDSSDLEIMLGFLTGRPQESVDSVTSWKQAERLYRMVDKYQLDGHRPWFVEMCCAHAASEPWEALFLACNQSPMIKSLVRASLTIGFRRGNNAVICDPRYFKNQTVWNFNHQMSEKGYVLDSSNTTVELGFKLGLKGFLAYHQTFQTLHTGIPSWDQLTERFIENAIAIERKACNASLIDQTESHNDQIATMDDADMEIISGSHRNRALSITAPRYCKAFNDPVGNVVFKTSDHVIFRVQDFYLKATSGLFRDMLNDSIPSITVANPLPIEEGSVDFEIMLLIITGHPQEVLGRVKTWDQAERLYRLVDKYQLEGHRPWFSELCRANADEQPWEALFLACNQGHADTTIIRAAIAEGFFRGPTSVVCNKAYFKCTSTRFNEGTSTRFNEDDADSGMVTTKHRTLDSSNIAIALGLKLGFKGLLAYNLTFASLAAAGYGADWLRLAERFVTEIRKIEEASSSCE